MAKSRKPGKTPKRKTSLAAFFRKLWSRPELLARFSRSPAGREEVLQGFNLSARHRRILVGGCMRDIIRELAGVSAKTAASNTIIDCTDDPECGHPECKAFMKAVRPR